MEDVVNPWKGRRVFLTGHTGFKGGWLALWLASRGAIIRGYALDPSTEPNLFTTASIASVLDDVRGDIRDYDTLKHSMAEFQPEVVFHLAAQPLVRRSYSDPLGTYATNVMGTAHTLEAVRETASVRCVVCITTDKCYENREWVWPYRENDPLGGYDPYSSSKACAEIVSAAYRTSFFPADPKDGAVGWDCNSARWKCDWWRRLVGGSADSRPGAGISGQDRLSLSDDQNRFVHGSTCWSRCTDT